MICYFGSLLRSKVWVESAILSYSRFPRDTRQCCLRCFDSDTLRDLCKSWIFCYFCIAFLPFLCTSDYFSVPRVPKKTITIRTRFHNATDHCLRHRRKDEVTPCFTAWLQYGHSKNRRTLFRSDLSFKVPTHLRPYLVFWKGSNTHEYSFLPHISTVAVHCVLEYSRCLSSSKLPWNTSS